MKSLEERQKDKEQRDKDNANESEQIFKPGENEKYSNANGRALEAAAIKKGDKGWPEKTENKE